MIRVAAYCRVSTEHEDQANSFDSQRRYFRDCIDANPKWELSEIYADEGITGTSTKKRTQFNRMISDAHSGKFQLILTKEVSRFSRNLLDTIAYTRELKALGVGVVFLSDGFSSLDPDSELRLSIMGSIAQEESRKTSARVKWGQTRQMERGVVFGTSMLGYDVCSGKLTINPEGAGIVRLIFQKYGLEKKGTTVIARELREAGYRTYSGNPLWSSSHIVKILRNEKYVGDLVQKKTITPDYLTHAKRQNRGEEALISIRDHHEPIIDRELWDTVQRELAGRSRKKDAPLGRSRRYACSGKIRCGECGAVFVARWKKRKSGSSYLRWCCYTAVAQGSCGIGKTLRDELALEAIGLAVRSIPMDFEWVIQNLTQVLRTAMNAPSENARSLEDQIRRLERKKEAALDAFLSGAITREELQRMKAVYDRRLSPLRERLQVCKEPSEPALEQLNRRIEAIVSCEEPSEPLYKLLLSELTVHKNATLQLKLCHLPQVWHFLLEYHKTRP